MPLPLGLLALAGVTGIGVGGAVGFTLADGLKSLTTLALLAGATFVGLKVAKVI